MKTERAQELYSDYAEGILSPALAQALEQHFETAPEDRADYERFAQVYKLLDAEEAPPVDVPLGFRAKVLELAAEEHARRESAASRQANSSIAGWLKALFDFRQHRATGGVIAAFAVIALAAVLVRQVPQGVTEGGLGPLIQTTSTLVVQSDTASGTTHLFHIHLPANIQNASVMAYVLTSTDQIANPAQSGIAALAQPEHLTNTEELQIPVTLTQQSPPGTTLNLLVEWTPARPGERPGKQVVFAPVAPGVPSADNGQSPVSGSFFGALEALAAEYNVTVVADASVTPNAVITPPTMSGGAEAALRQVASQANYQVRKISDNTYQVYNQ